MAGQLKPKDFDTLDFAAEVFGGSEKIIDGIDLGRVMRCCGVNPSLETLEKLGATKKEGEKKFKVDDLVPVLVELQKEVKDQGCYEDFIECLKLYDKNENDTMLAAELTHMMLTLGEKLTDAEVDELFEDTLDEEDDDGYIEYLPFLRRMCELDPPIPKKKKN